MKKHLLAYFLLLSMLSLPGLAFSQIVGRAIRIVSPAEENRNNLSKGLSNIQVKAYGISKTGKLEIIAQTQTDTQGNYFLNVTLQYHYDAAGSKLRMSNSNGAVNTKYAGSFEYDQSNYLIRIATEEGQISITSNGNEYAFEYHLKDHLGNVRMVMNEAGAKVQETEYFPFGLAIPKTAGMNKHLL